MINKPDFGAAVADSETTDAHAVGKLAVAPEDGERAILYGILASGLEQAADRGWLAAVAALPRLDGEIGAPLAELSRISATVDPEALRREYHDLFIGVGRGELVPYASYYLTGFLNEKPLALLRQDMRRLGIERDPDIHEPEDHIAAVCAMMAGLIDGSFGEGGEDEASAFFRAHLAVWAPYFFKDLAASTTGELYPALGRLGQAFLAVEVEADRLFAERRKTG
ncbi:TorD/DmsD family molecular chaperone [Stappia indica]|uniref:Molecular chaperone TorD n=1 Tax=Stappia indica TaxID=538381 RepID=A0A857C2K2_9HYPH|nr:molecular chaperone TorD family protein [Stappia indica]QGZ33058.1 molecular chaperone TorD [Stappia indica]